jgi:cytochrome c oxidase subunit 2
VVLALLLAACAKTPQTVLDPQGPQAEKVNKLFTLVWPVALLFFVIVEGMIIVAVVRFRHRPNSAEPAQIHGNMVLEIGWTALPALILAVLAVPTIGTLFDLSHEPKGALKVDVIGHQWWWEYSYPGLNVVTANELHIPTGQPVRLTLESDEPRLGAKAKGVIHSFWVPALAGKIDVVPGRHNKLTLIADHPGEYLGQCAEFCGISHANMRLRVIAEEPAAFRGWVQQQQQPAPTPIGLFNSKGCIGCHTINSGGPNGNAGARVGPNLTHLQSRSTFAGAIFDMNAEELREWLANPPKRKPGSIMPNLHLTQDEINQLVNYLETLK